MKKHDILAVAGLVALTALAFAGRVESAAVVTFLGGVLIRPEALDKSDA